MKKLLIFGKTVEISIYIALGMFAVKTIFSLILGYLRFPIEYAGPSYYYWRHTYCDKELAKNTFTYVKPNTEDAKEPFLTYNKYAQPLADPSAKKGDLESLKKKLSDAEARLSSETSEKMKSKIQTEIAELEKSIKKIKEHELDVKFNSLGLTPLYAPYKFTDGFVYGPKKSFKVFKTKGNVPSDLLKFELDFLAFRNVFLTYLSKKENIEKFTSVSKDTINEFFTNENEIQVDTLTHEDMKKSLNEISKKVDDGEIKETSIFKLTLKSIDDTSFYFLESQAYAVLAYHSILSNFNELISLIETSKLAELKESTIMFTEDAQNLINLMAEKIGLLNEKAGLKAPFTSKDEFTKASNEFLQRIASIKPTAMDSHILNRFYYYYLFTRSDLSLENLDISDELPIKEQLSIQESLSAKAEKTPKDTSKLKVFDGKISKGRIELIFNKLSQDIANSLGNKGYLLDSKDDDRLIPFKYFAYPSTYSPSKKEKVTSPFASEKSAASA